MCYNKFKSIITFPAVDFSPQPDTFFTYAQRMMDMKFFKSIILLFLTLLLTFLTVTGVITTAVNKTVFNPSYIKNMLDITNSYTLIYSQIPSLISVFLPEGMYKHSTGIGRYVINNIPKEGLKAQSELLIDEFYSYLEGTNISPSIDLAPLKDEIKSMNNEAGLSSVSEKTESVPPNPLDNIPSSLKLNNPSSSAVMYYLARAYHFFDTIPLALAAAIALCILLMLLVIRNILKLTMYISLSLVLSSFILGLFYLEQKVLFVTVFNLLFNNPSAPELKMLSISLHPVIFYTLSSMLSDMLHWSAVTGISGVILILATRKCVIMAGSALLSRIKAALKRAVRRLPESKLHEETTYIKSADARETSSL